MQSSWWQSLVGAEGAGEMVRSVKGLAKVLSSSDWFLDKKRACQLTAIQKCKKGKPQTQAPSSKAVRKKAHSCFIQTQLVVAWAQRDGRNVPDDGISTLQFRLSLCKSHGAEGIPARCWGRCFACSTTKVPAIVPEHTLVWQHDFAHAEAQPWAQHVVLCHVRFPDPAWGWWQENQPALKREKWSYKSGKI